MLQIGEKSGLIRLNGFVDLPGGDAIHEREARGVDLRSQDEIKEQQWHNRVRVESEFGLWIRS